MAYSEKVLDLRRRSVNMPTVFEAQNHPSLTTSPSSSKRSVYIGYMKTDPGSMKEYLTFEKKLKCPPGTIKEWKDQGLLEMVPGDVMFLRDAKHASTPPTQDILTKDVLAALVSGSFHHEPDELANFEAATLRILGPRDRRTPDLTAFEETKCARKIRKKRCYSGGLAIQQSRRVVAPTASLDQDKANIQEYQQMTKDLIDSTAAMLLNVEDLFPEECRVAFKANAELTGQPSVGVLGVHGTSSVQINISAAGLSAGDNRLGNQLGDFGCEHFDRNDSPDHFTTMFSNPDIPEEYEPGAFHILQLGVFVVLRKFVGVTFSGRRRHVGTAPTPPLGFPSVPYAYRFNVVWYPKQAAVDGSSRWTLASLPGKGSAATDKQKLVSKGANEETTVEHLAGNGLELEVEDALSDDEEGEQEAKKGAEDPEPLYLTPEMINIDNKGAVSRTTNRATFARSGHILMDRQAHMNFMGRSLHQLTSYIWRQLPQEYGVHIDVDKLLRAVTYTNEEDGLGRVSLLPWASAPNVNQVSQEREENAKVWSAYQAKVRRFIPHLAGKPSATKVSGSVPLAVDSGDPASGGDTRVQGSTATAVVEISEDEEVYSDEGLPSKNHKQGKGKKGTVPDGRGGRSVRATQGKKIAGRKIQGGREAQKKGEAVKDKERGKGREVRHQQIRAQDVSEHSSSQSIQNAGSVGGPTQPSVSWRKVPLQMARQDDTGPSEGHAATTSKRSREDSSDNPDFHTKRPRLVGEGQGEATPQIFPFIQGLGLDVMRREAEEIEWELSVASDLSIRELPDASRVPRVLAASNALVKEPLSLVAPAHVRDLLAQVRLGVESEVAQAIDSRLRRYSVLVSNVRIWYWLDVTIRHSVRGLFNSSVGATTADSGWLAAMVTVAKTCLEGKIGPLIRFDPQKYPALLALRSSAITVPNSCRRLFTTTAKDQEELLKAVTQVVRTALMEALEFPRDVSMSDRRRAWLLGTLVDTIGPCFLATRYAWNAWTSFAVKDYFSAEKMYKDDPNLILPFKQALALHAICQDQSRIQILYHRFCRSFCGMALSAPTPNGSRTTSTLVEITSLGSRLDTRLSRLVDFLRACLGYIDATLPARHQVHQLISRNPDYYLPFREKAPSRIRFNGPKGPFQKPLIQRTTGLFSALVFRGITYNTPYSRHPGSQMQFIGEPHVLVAIDIFKQRYPAEPTEDPHYFCNPNAYSRQPITGRALSAENLKSFWDKAVALDWVARTSQMLSFSECLGLLTSAKFPAMGTLQMFLLVADLHYAGVCSPPELSDVVDFIYQRKPKGGSLKGLASLGLIANARTASRQEIESALQALDAHLKMAFVEEERSRMGFDMICVEHLLCKFQRALNEGIA